MALIGKIRQKAQLLASVIAIALLFFMVRELFGFNPFSHSNQAAIVGVIAGEKITREAFQHQVEVLKHNFFMNYEQSPSEEEISFLRKQVWQQFVNEKIYTKLCQELGIQVTEDELVDLVQGEHIHPDLKVAFSNKETKEFNKEDLLKYLQNLSQASPAYQSQWHEIEQKLAHSRCQTKLNQLLEKSIFINSLEVSQKVMMDSTTVSLAYLYIPYQSIPDDSVQVTSLMIKKYFDKHANAYRVKEKRDVSYVTFPIVASLQDEKDFQIELENLKQEFIKVSEDSLFASSHTDAANPSQVFFETTEKDLPEPLVALKHKLKKGEVIGPMVDGKRHKLYKVTLVKGTKPQDKVYGLSVIEKILTPSDQTKEASFQLADAFASKATNLQHFNTQAAQDDLSIYTAQLSKNDTNIGRLHHARDLVRWLYNSAKVGAVSTVFEVEDNYVVAVVTGLTKKGTDTLDHVQKEIQRKVMHAEKAKMIIAKLTPIANLPLDTLSSQYGNGAKVFEAQDLKFHTSSLTGVGTATKIIPQAFSLAEGKRSSIIADATGVVLFDVIKRNSPTLTESLLQESKSQQLRFEQFNQSYQIMPKALEKLTDTKDYRYKYY